MQKYTPLTDLPHQKQRFSLRFMAKTLEVSVPTMSREMSRNTGKQNYCPKQAIEAAEALKCGT